MSTETTNRTDWETPKWLFNLLNEEFRFNLDAAANKSNSLCGDFLCEADNALKITWKDRVWCNPPYTKDIGKWLKKAYDESCNEAEVVVMLIKATPETRAWNDWALKAKEIRFIDGRVLFELDGKPVLSKKGSIQSGTFPSAVVIFKNEEKYPKCSRIKNPKKKAA